MRNDDNFNSSLKSRKGISVLNLAPTMTVVSMVAMMILLMITQAGCNFIFSSSDESSNACNSGLATDCSTSSSSEESAEEETVETPTVSGVTITVSGSDQTLDITGTGFADGVTVTVGSTECSSVNVVSSTQLTCVVPSGTDVSSGIVVSNGDVSSESDASYSSTLAAALSIIGGSSFTYPNVNVGQSFNLGLTVQNTGDLEATNMTASGLSSPIDFHGSTYPGTTATCGSTLAAGSTCTLIISFAPSATGTTNNTLSIAYSDGGVGNTMTFAFSGTAIPASGSLDTTLDSDGYAYTAGTGSSAYGYGSTILSDGKILAIAEAANKWVVYKMNTDGSLDTTFGDSNFDGTMDSTGYTIIDFTNLGESPRSITTTSGGKILVAGLARSASANNIAAVAVMDSDGTPDTSFDSDGMLTIDFAPYKGTEMNNNNQLEHISVDTNGKYLVTGSLYADNNTDNLIFARLNTDGTLDTTLLAASSQSDTNGAAVYSTPDHANITSNIYGRGIYGLSDGKMVVVGEARGSNREPFIARFNSDGSFDTDFDGDSTANGLVRTTVANDQFIASHYMYSDGKFLLGGGQDLQHNDVGASSFIIRYNSDGTLDTTFSSDGYEEITSGVGKLYGITVTSSGLILASGQTDEGTTTCTRDFGVARFLSTGALDTNFDSDGMKKFDVCGATSTNTECYAGRGIHLHTTDAKAIVFATSTESGASALCLPTLTQFYY